MKKEYNIYKGEPPTFTKGFYPTCNGLFLWDVCDHKHNGEMVISANVIVFRRKKDAQAFIDAGCPPHSIRTVVVPAQTKEEAMEIYKEGNE